MVDKIKRDSNDIYGIPVVGFLFKNPTFLLLLKLVVLALFVYATFYGFHFQGSENVFTTGLFWGLFWPFFMVLTLATLGRVFCGICPHGFMGKYLTKFGLQKKLPKALQNPMIGLIILVIGWWFVYYLFPGIYKTPYATALIFTVLTLLAVVTFFVYEKMAYCKSICPIGIITRVFSKVGFTFLSTYKSECNSCKTFECAKACIYDLKPFTFNKKNSMGDCTLCMDCSTACEAVSFKIVPPSKFLVSKFKPLKAEVWALILITAAITITMNFHHALGRSAIVEEFIWVKTARYFESIFPTAIIDMVGLFSFAYALAITLFLSIGGLFVASRILNKNYGNIFTTLGYAFAPLFIIGGLSHMGEFFFYAYASEIVNAFIQAFHLNVEYIEPLATRRDKWVHIFTLFNYVAFFWSITVLVLRFRHIESSRLRKWLAFPFAGALIIFYFYINVYKIYVFNEYGAQKRAHNHSAHMMKGTKHGH